MNHHIELNNPYMFFSNSKSFKASNQIFNNN